MAFCIYYSYTALIEHKGKPALFLCFGVNNFNSYVMLVYLLCYRMCGYIFLKIRVEL